MAWQVPKSDLVTIAPRWEGGLDFSAADGPEERKREGTSERAAEAPLQEEGDCTAGA